MKRRTLDLIREAARAKRPAALARNLDSGDETLIVGGTVADGPAVSEDVLAAVRTCMVQDKGRTVETESGRLFIQVFNPPLRLIIVGAVHIAQPLAPMAVLAGYDVTIVDPRGAFASDERFPGYAINRDWPDEALEALAPDARTAVVTLSHDPKLDDPALAVALRSDAFYIASLGSKRTHAARLERLGALGHDSAALARIHGPAGFPIGAVSPAEIAISIMAEMTAELRREDRA